MIKVNGVEYHGSRVSVRNGIVVVDGKEIGTVGGNVSIQVEGTLHHLDCDGNVTCSNVAGNVTAGGSVRCDNIGGIVIAGGSVDCGRVKGKVMAGGNINILD